MTLDSIFTDYVLDFALSIPEQGEKIALVTLVRIEGSAPRPVGAQMAVSASGESRGYLSGGCIEHAVIAEAQAAIAAGVNRLVRYGQGSDYIDIQLPCGSAVELFFDVTITRQMLETIDKHYRARQSVAMRIDVKNMSADVIADDSDDSDEAMVTVRYSPPLRLIIIGIGPVAVRLAQLADVSGFDVSLYSPDAATLEFVRESQIAAHPVPTDVTALRNDADRRTALVMTFHDHEHEQHLWPALLLADWLYVGAMGSRETHRNRIAMLRTAGVSESQLADIQSPAGVFVSGKRASEIAVSMLAQIMRQAHQD